MAMPDVLNASMLPAFQFLCNLVRLLEILQVALYYMHFACIAVLLQLFHSLVGMLLFLEE